MQSQCEGNRDIFLSHEENENITKGSRKLLKKQLKKNERAWKCICGHESAGETEFCLNFRFTSKDRLSVESLMNYVCSRTDYDVNISQEGRLRKYWSVHGATRPLKLSEEILDKWVSQMVTLGAEHGCAFRGWWLWKENACARRHKPRLIESNPPFVRRLARLFKLFFGSF